MRYLSARLIIINLALGLCLGCGAESKDEEGQANDSGPAIETPQVEDLEETQPIANISEKDLKLAPLPSSGIPPGFASWTELEAPGFEQKSWQVLDGYDQVQELLGNRVPCSVYILAAYLDEKGHPTYLVKTSFSHVGDTHSHLKVTLSDALALSARGEDSEAQNQIFFKLARGGDLLAATQMNIKWLHINHFDTGICTTLVLRKKA